MNDEHSMSRSDRLSCWFTEHPEASACRHCGSPIRPHRVPRVWEHVTTGLVRCVGTDRIAVAHPVEGQVPLFPAIVEEVA
ncbi:hypothetical protein [Saccharopolyspora hordei]|uniref:Ribosomal protein L32 n=1 Tax=Saccharopolyspora hordei TaxID=1838 RepID=A0A853AUW4_9PSEU|nr:hypothetical protein [Saccharopolyspora hordei]NYI86422.1 ribosomal protein L32 [Saccharopolyspora hordei]